ncbi:helix-turn-helix domain-containing protein [Devosia sp. A449]
MELDVSLVALRLPNVCCCTVQSPLLFSKRLHFVPEAFRNVRGWIDAYREQIVPMDIFARRLRERAEQLGISNAEAGRRAGLDERRYAHYANGRREPDLATLVRIAAALATTPNWLLGLSNEGESSSARSDLLERLQQAAVTMPETELRLFCIQAEAIARTLGETGKKR